MTMKLGSEGEHTEPRQVHSVTFFGPKRPVEGTIFVLPPTSNSAVQEPGFDIDHVQVGDG